jgi:hypothetical protein
VTGDAEEPQRVLGIPLRTRPHARQGEEPQRVLGLPVDWFDQVRGLMAALAQRIQGNQRQVRRPGSEGDGPTER